MSEVSRLGREQIETAWGLKQLSTAGVRCFRYLDDRELLMESATDKFLLSAVNFAAEIEREKGRQRTYDAMLRKARAGHVTGGRVFGYDNVRTDAGHVERRINQQEAVVVRRIFEMCAKGNGRITIAKTLNAEGAIAPRSQQGRPCGWVDSSVREALYRELYRGVNVWNQSRKRNTWGQVHQHARPEAEWVRVPAPKLRIVSEALWRAAHERLAEARASYLRATGGRLWGKPKNGVASKYLLTGLSRCGVCGGSFEVQSRSHGRKRAYFYACAAYYRRGASICANSLVIPLDTMDAAVVETFAPLLTREFIEAVVRKVLTRAVPVGPELDEARETLRRGIGGVRRELDHLIEAVASTGGSRPVTVAIKAREARLDHLERELGALERREHVSEGEVSRLEALARQKVAEWRDLPHTTGAADPVEAPP